MSRLIIVMLTLLAIVTFFLGLRMGKYIQRIDTPVQIKYQVKEKMVVVTATPVISQSLGKGKAVGQGEKVKVEVKQ